MSKRRFLLLGASLIASAILGAQPVQQLTPEIKGMLTRYYDAVERADTVKALSALNELITADPDFPYYYSARASVVAALGKTPADSILSDLDRAAALLPEDINILKQRAAFTMGYPSDNMQIIAMHDLMSLIQLDSLQFDHYRKCHAYVTTLSDDILQAFLRQAERVAYQLTTQDAANAENWFHLGEVYTWKYNAAPNPELLFLARSYITKAISIDPAKTHYYIERAKLSVHDTALLDEAIADYESAMQLSSKADWFLSLALLYDQRGDGKKALHLIETGLSFYPDHYGMTRARKQLRK